MGIAKPPPSVCSSSKKTTTIAAATATTTTAATATATCVLYHNSQNSMSQEYHHHPGNFFTFPSGLDRSAGLAQQQAHTSDDPAGALHPAGMLSEMLWYGPTTPPELLDYRRAGAGVGPDWYASTRQVSREAQAQLQPHSMGSINAHDSASAMQLFATNPPPRSPSPPPPQPPTAVGGGGFHPNFWGTHHRGGYGGIVEGQGLSLSLSSLQNQAHLWFGSASTSSTLGVVNVLRNSKYAKPAQELLQEFCSVGRDQMSKKPKLGRVNSSNNDPSTSGGGVGGGSGVGSSSAAKDPTELSPADRVDHQRRKVKLLAMLEEVERRYGEYREQMQMVVNSLELIMGYGAAAPYTVQGRKAMSRHFRWLKDAICEAVGETTTGTETGLTKGETPRLKRLEQSLRQQRAFHQMAVMDPQEAWRPHRGLPDRSVHVLRAWLFEHFLHPYPSDADKHLLARQSGLSRNQVSNWFINARVRLWKPMVEEMYQQEAKEQADKDDNDQITDTIETTTTASSASGLAAQNPMPCSYASTELKRCADTLTPVPPPADRDPSIILAFSRPHPPLAVGVPAGGSHNSVGPANMIRLGTSGDVSLTLGLRHAGNPPDKIADFSVSDFGNC